METGIIEGVTEVIESKTEAICDRSALPDGTALENGRYEIRTTLGNGGFGITYKAWDYRLQRFVAIKEFFPDGFAYRDAGQSREVRCIQDAQTFQHGKHRFQKEAQLLAKLDFSHIVRVHDSFEENNTVYIVMEYINGETLNRYVRRTGPIAASYLRELFLPLLRDLDAIHRAGMIHRDISPDNIMVTAEDGQLKLIDFGTAKDLTRSNERTIGYSVSQSVVRMNYSPIEMFSTVEKKPSADVYSLCATMYFCLTGTEPPSSMDRAFDDTLKLPSGLNGHDRNLEKVILKGMSLKPDGRYASAEELIQALSGQTKERIPRQERKPQQEQKNQKGTLKWLPAVLGCIAAIAALILIPAALLTSRGEQSGNTKSSQQLIAAPTIKHTQTESTKQAEAPKTPEASTAGEASKAGTYEENEYRNDFFGFRITLDDTWSDTGYQELNAECLAERGISVYQPLEEEINRLDNYDIYGDMLYLLSETSSEKPYKIQVIVGKEEYSMDYCVGSVTRALKVRGSDVQVEEEYIKLETSSLRSLHATGLVVDGTEAYVRILLTRSGDYAAAIVMITYGEDHLNELMQYVSFQ